jgi:hypothetical protein
MRAFGRAVLITAVLALIASAVLVFIALVGDVAHATNLYLTGDLPATPAKTASATGWPEEILAWAWAVFASVGGVLSIIVGKFVVQIVANLASRLGIQVTDALKKQLYDMTVNAINKEAAAAEARGEKVTKDGIAGPVLAYVKEHGVDIATKLGVDVNSPEFAEGTQARMEKALNDPNQPTPPSITPEPKPAVPTVAPAAVPA